MRGFLKSRTGTKMLSKKRAASLVGAVLLLFLALLLMLITEGTLAQGVSARPGVVYVPMVRRDQPPPPTPTPWPTLTPTSTPTPGPPPQDPRAYVNYFRGLAGVPPVTFDAILDDNCFQHARYMAENNHLTHDQNPGWPYASASGQVCASKGNAWLGGASGTPRWTPLRPVTGWMASLGHRLWLLYPTTPTFGYGFYTAGNNRAGGALDVLSEARFGQDAAYSGWPVRYPAPHQSGVPALAYPITVNWRYFGPTPTVSTSRLRIVGGSDVPHTVTTSLPVNHKGIGILPNAPLPNDTVFEVSVSGSYDGQPFSYTWQFATGNAAVP